MNGKYYQILTYLNTHKEENFSQRDLANALSMSLGSVNSYINQLTAESYLDTDGKLTEKAQDLFIQAKPDNAIILAAGYGMRMVPINTLKPKGLLTIHGKPLIEKTIEDLQAAGIHKIYIVVGFLKEMYEYLIDQYNVTLIYNEDYATKNNLASLNKAYKYIHNSYIIPCDVYTTFNPYSSLEICSWYMMADQPEDKNGHYTVNKQLHIVKTNSSPLKMVGISYVTGVSEEILKHNLQLMSQDEQYDSVYWEKALFTNNNHVIGKIVKPETCYEIDTYEQLRNIDNQADELQNDAISTIVYTFNVKPSDIKNISVLKKGMTNRSFLFECNNQKYIMRIPGEGTDQLVNRQEEYDVYMAIKGKGLCDDNIYINPTSGYKITKFINNSRNCDPDNIDDLKKCMEKLRDFHNMKLKVNHTFDIFKHMEFYETLWEGNPSIFNDYEDTKKKVYELKEYIDAHPSEYCLTHIDAVCDNFMISTDENGQEKIDLIDWEYAGMQDPHVDIAMFCIYAMYDRAHVDQLIDIYFENNCPQETRLKIYCYIACCGLLWSNWCEFKRNKGVEFGEYSLAQYRYAKDYYKIFKEEIKNV